MARTPKQSTKVTLWESPGLATPARTSNRQTLNKSAQSTALEVKGEPAFPRGSSFGSRFNVQYPGTSINYANDVGKLHHSSLVMAPVNFIGVLLTEPPPQVVEFDKKDVAEAVKDHPMVKLLNNPNPWTTGDRMMMAFALDWLINGNVYWMKERDPKNYQQVVRLWPLPAFMVTPKWDERDPASFITAFRYRVNGRNVDYLPEDILHFPRGTDPDNQRLGLGAFQSVLREIFGDNVASNFSAVALKNWGVLPFVLSPKKGVIVDGDNSDPFAGLTDDEARAKAQGIKQSFIQGTTGDNVGQPLVQTIPLDITKLGFNARELDISNLTLSKEARVAAVTGIPAQVLGYLVGLINGTNRATYEQAVTQAYNMVVMPMMKTIASTINNNLLPEFGSAKGAKQEFRFDFSKVQALQEDRDKLYTRANASVSSGLISVNMGRESIGKPLLDVDVIYLPVGARPVTPETLKLLAEMDPTAILTPPPPDPNVIDGIPEPLQIGDGKGARHHGNGNGHHHSNGHRPHHTAVKSVEYDGMNLWREPTPLEKTINLKAIQDAFDSGEKKIEKELLDLREKLISAAIAGIIVLSPADYHTLTLEAPEGSIDDLRKELQKIYDRGRQLVIEELTAQGASGLGNIGDPDEVDAADLDTLAGLSASRLMNDLQARVIGAAAALAVLGLTGPELETRLQEEIDAGSTGYAHIAALQADHAALNSGRESEMADRDGSIRLYIQSSVLDNATCQICEADDGMESENIEDLPGAPHPGCLGMANCRDVIIAVYDDEAKADKPRKRRRRRLPASGPLTTPERDAIISYQSDGYRINKALREDFEVSESDLLDSALKKSTIVDTVTVYHGLGEVLPRNLELLKTIGAEITDAGYLSCSLKMNHARLFSTSGMETVLAITLPKGAAGYRSDDELILERDLSLRVVGSLKDGETNIIQVIAVKYSDDQERDEGGRWSAGGGSGSSSSSEGEGVNGGIGIRWMGT